MKKMNAFEDIIAWQKARLFNKSMHTITNKNFVNDFDLIRQIRSASVSISSTIAEGFERNTDKEFIRFLFDAKASAGEVRSQLYLALDLNYLTQQEFNQLSSEIN